MVNEQIPLLPGGGGGKEDNKNWSLVTDYSELPLI